MSDSVLFYSMRICLKMSLKLNIFFLLMVAILTGLHQHHHALRLEAVIITASSQRAWWCCYVWTLAKLIFESIIRPHTTAASSSSRASPDHYDFIIVHFQQALRIFFFCNASSLVSEDMPILLQIILLCEWVTDATEYTNCSICIFVHLW